MWRRLIKGSDYIARRLKHAGVKYVYGCIGGAITHLVDSIRQQDDLDFFHFYNEQGASFAASSAAKYSDRLQVAAATSGPGATNLITGIADAYFDSAPVLFLTGQVNTYDFKYDRPVRQFGFQETNIVNIVKPITKRSVLIDDPACLVQEFERCIELALSGRPGPVCIDIPMDVQRSEIPDDAVNESVARQKVDSTASIERGAIIGVIEAVASARKPLILVGGGCRKEGARKSLREFVSLSGLPVAVTLMGKGNFPEDDPLFTGFIGAYGNRYANITLAECDLLLVLGARLDSRQIGNTHELFKQKVLIQVDIDECEMGQRLKPDLAINADVREFLSGASQYLNETGALPQLRQGWLRAIEELKAAFPAVKEPERAGKCGFHYNVMEAISTALGDDDVVTVDVGQNQMLAAQMLRMRGNQRYINSGGMAPMGFALPAAVPPALQYGRRSVAIVGDGGMQMNIQELNVLASFGLPVIVFVFNNCSLGMIKQFQELYFGSRFCDVDAECGYYTPDFVAIAEAYGIEAMRITNNDADWEMKIEQAMSHTVGPLVVDIALDYQTYIFPKLEFDKQIDKLDPQLSTEEAELVTRIMEKVG